MKKTFGIIALAALVMLAGCKKNEQTTGTKLTAGIEQNKSNSKTSLNDLTITWSAGDQLYVNNGTDAACFTLTSNPGATSGEFATTGEYTFTDENVAVYPYNENITVGNNKVTMTLPDVQTASNSSTFGNGANPMLGVFANPANIQLTSLCGVLCLQLTGDNVEITDIKIEGGADDKLNGTFEADYTVTTPVLAKTGDDGTNAVTLHLQETTMLNTTVQKFYVVLPAVTLANGFTMKVYNGTNEIFSQSTTASLNIPVNTVESMNALEVTPAPAVDLTTPLTLEALTDGTIVVSNPKSGMQYSLNGGAKTPVTSDAINVSAGNKVAFYGNGTSINNYDGTKIAGGTAQVKVYGNIMSLLDEDNYATAITLTTENTFKELFRGNTTLTDASGLLLPATTLANSCYMNMFFGCSSLTSAPALPATTLANRCYLQMFRGCSLTAAPALPATTLAESCYQGMFSGCTSLTTAPELPVTTLFKQCYCNMFNGCTSLTTAPVLPATTLAEGCYYGMFQGCTSLTTAPALPATTLAYQCCYSMFQGCSTLTAAPALPATTMEENCYYRMFYGCIKLTSAPVLPATTMAPRCYYQMFYGCTSLTTAPALPATTVADFCYREMFRGCTKLSSITCLAPQGINLNGITDNWVNGVASTGTFTKASGVTWWTGTSGIPSGWTVNEQ